MHLLVQLGQKGGVKMNFAEKYNSIITFIEENLHRKTDEISQIMAGELKISKRALGETFQFMTGLSINEYVRNRRIVNAMRYKLQTDCPLEMVAEEFGFPDQPTISRTCKEALGFSPSQVTEEMLDGLHPLQLQDLFEDSGNGRILPMRKADRMNAFGITKSTFSEIRLFLEENTYYDFDDDYLDLAYQIKEKYDLSIEAAYNLMEEIKLHSEGKFDKVFVKWAKEYAFLRLKYGVKEWDIVEIIEQMHEDGEKDITKAEHNYLEVYLGEYAQRIGLKWDTVKIMLVMMRHREIPFEKFEDITKKAVLFRGDILLAVNCSKTFDEYLKIIEEDIEVLKEEIERIKYGYVIDQLKELGEHHWIEVIY